MDSVYSRKSGQIPAFGDWENANEMPITQYFECARQAGLAHCSCSVECCRSFRNNAVAWGGAAAPAAAAGSGADLYGVSFEEPLRRRVYAVPQRKMTKQFKVEESIDRTRNHRSVQKHCPKRITESGNIVFQKSSLNVKPVDEDLYKISPELVKNSKRKRMFRFFSSCMSSMPGRWAHIVS
ncbi:hypothetical protein OROGR_002270 [Orobanche gracilis]